MNGSVRSWVLGLMLAAAPQFAMGELSQSVRETVAKSVVQVRASGCPDGDRVATGFVYGKPTHIVTAFHVISGCSDFNVFFERQGGRVSRATVERTHASEDLALLTIPDSGVSVLRTASRSARVDDRLEAIGYSLSVQTMSNTPLVVRFGDDRLTAILPPKVRNEVRSGTRINLDMRILRLDGHLLPGLSGAPILSRDGDIVGIGMGGLKTGAASISWAAPADALQRLMSSNERDIAGGARMAALFAASSTQELSSARQFTCGGLDFIETGIRSFADLSITADDQPGLQHLLALADLDADVLEAFRYRIFTPIAGGAVIATPDWMDVSGFGDHCRAVGPDGVLRIEFGGARVANASQVQAASVAFENAFIFRSGRQWQADLSLSYLMPSSRFDGMVANRKTMVGYNQFGQIAVGFETLLNRASEFTGAIAVTEWWDVNAINYCDAAPYDPQCSEINAYLTRVAQAILGVHLSTFPVI